MTPEEFWETYFEKGSTEEHPVEAQVDFILEKVDDLLEAKAHNKVNAIIEAANIQRMTVQDIINLLTCTLHEASTVAFIFGGEQQRITYPARLKFMALAKLRIEELEGTKRVRSLLRGLDP